MPSDDQIAVMVEVAQNGGLNLNAGQRSALHAACTDGLIEPTSEKSEKPEKYRLTPKGQSALDERGVGANES